LAYSYDCRGKDRVPVREYLMRQGRFAHLIDEDINYIQSMVDQMWNEWDIPGVAPLRANLQVARKQPAAV
jgi:pyruvate ferredoxin oxidoreductase beta subunit